MPESTTTPKFAIPKGSLEAPTIDLLAKAGYEVYVSSRGLRPSSNDPELDLYLIRAQEIGLKMGEIPIHFYNISERTSFVKLPAIFEFIKNIFRYRFFKTGNPLKKPI